MKNQSAVTAGAPASWVFFPRLQPLSQSCVDTGRHFQRGKTLPKELTALQERGLRLENQSQSQADFQSLPGEPKIRSAWATRGSGLGPWRTKAALCQVIAGVQLPAVAGPGRRPHQALSLNISVYFHVEPCLVGQGCGKQRDLPGYVKGIFWIHRERTVDTERGTLSGGSDLEGKGPRNLSQGGFTGAKVSPSQHGTLWPLLADGLTRSKDSTSQENLFRTAVNRNPNSNGEAKF
ncbi:hypothetical protein ACRRTK_011871 [Alexandromys fortis]